jgi:hypothetical protein
VADVSVIHFSDIGDSYSAVVAPVHGISASPLVTVSGMTVSANTNLGYYFTCTLTTVASSATIANTTWTDSVVATDGTNTVTVPQITVGTGTGLTCTIMASIPGVYTINALTTYNAPLAFPGQPVPPTPAPTSSSATVTVPPPSIDANLVPAAGITTYSGAGVTATTSVSTSVGLVGPGAVGSPQELIPGFINT